MRFSATLILLLSLLSMPSGSRSQDAQPSEYQVKAALIFAFAKYVEWPAASFTNAQSPLCVGVLGEHPFGADLEQTMHGKIVNSRPLVVKECQTLEEARKS